MRACEIAGIGKLRCEVTDMSRDEATIFMVESNFQRTTILPSEKAFAYKMRLDAMKRQAGRPSKENVGPVVQNYSRDIIGEDTGESGRQISRYIRLTELIPELLDMVDEGQMALRPAVEISYIPKDLQHELLDQIEMEQCTPSHAQTIRMRKLLNNGKLTPESIEAIMSEEKPNQKEKFVLHADRFRDLFPANLPISRREDYVAAAMEFYGKYLEKMRNEPMR